MYSSVSKMLEHVALPAHPGCARRAFREADQGVQLIGVSVVPEALLRLLGLQVQGLMSEHDVDLTEEEFALLIGVCTHGAPWAQTRALLSSMSQELTSLQEGTLAAVERLFRLT